MNNIMGKRWMGHLIWIMGICMEWKEKNMTSKWMKKTWMMNMEWKWIWVIRMMILILKTILSTQECLLLIQ